MGFLAITERKIKTCAKLSYSSSRNARKKLELLEFTGISAENIEKREFLSISIKANAYLYREYSSLADKTAFSSRSKRNLSIKLIKLKILPKIAKNFCKTASFLSYSQLFMRFRSSFSISSSKTCRNSLKPSPFAPAFA